MELIEAEGISVVFDPGVCVIDDDVFLPPLIVLDRVGVFFERIAPVYDRGEIKRPWSPAEMEPAIAFIRCLPMRSEKSPDGISSRTTTRPSTALSRSTSASGMCRRKSRTKTGIQKYAFKVGAYHGYNRTVRSKARWAGPSAIVPCGWLAVPHHSMMGFAEPTTLVPSGFSISIHHMVFSGSGSGAIAWMS